MGLLFLVSILNIDHTKLEYYNFDLFNLIILDGFTNLQILDRWLDSSFYNLVKACMNINAHVEVALLCCMKGPPDYGTSFQALKRVSDHHSLHVYYPLFWDTNLLECAIAQHHKRGETC